MCEFLDSGRENRAQLIVVLQLRIVELAAETRIAIQAVGMMIMAHRRICTQNLGQYGSNQFLARVKLYNLLVH